MFTDRSLENPTLDGDITLSPQSVSPAGIDEDGGAPSLMSLHNEPANKANKTMNMSCPEILTPEDPSYGSIPPMSLSEGKLSEGIIGSATNIFIAGLPSDFDDTRLRALFVAYGEISSCKIMVDVDTGVSKGFGFVRYHEAQSAAKAIEAMNGKRLSANCARTMYVTLAQSDGASSTTSCERVYVRNVPHHVSDEELRHVFGMYGEVREGRIIRHVDGSSKGVAFVRYASIEEAHKAVSRGQGTRPFGRFDEKTSKPLMVRFAETHEARQSRQARSMELSHGNSAGKIAVPPTAVPTPPQRVPPTMTPPSSVPPAALPPQPIVWQDPSTGLMFLTPPQPQVAPSPSIMMPMMVPYGYPGTPMMYPSMCNPSPSAMVMGSPMMGLQPAPSPMVAPQPAMIPAGVGSGWVNYDGGQVRFYQVVPRSQKN